VNPEIFTARRNLTGKGTKSWDLILIWILFAGLAAIPLVAGLDAGRFHWAPAPPWAVVLGYLLFATGYLGTGWPQAVNRHFEPSVRIQSDRDHQVITAGPYAYIRHPGYVFATILAVGSALALGSWSALVPAVLVALVLVVRTMMEDATLQRELPGYAEFAQRVRYKWIPGIW
jgi:protein-S-isoprenylcysteine O-methyltransferase Ste14